MSNPMKTNFKQFIILIPLVTMLFACGKKAEHETTSKAPIIVKTQTVDATPQNESFVVSGTLEAREESSIGFLVAGKVQQVIVNEGDYVHQGQLLAALDDADYANALRIAEATLTRTTDDFQRSSELYQRRSLSQSDFVKISTGVKEAEANYNITRKQVADTRLYAPISGFIAKKNVAPGEIVSAGVHAFTIVSTDPIKVRIAVPESEIGSVNQGMKTKVSIPALNDTIAEGSVSLIGAVADLSTRTYPVEITLPNAQHIMRPGMVADARIITTRVASSINIPGQAIVRNSDGVPMVFVVNTANMVMQRRVTLGELSTSGVEILSGLNAGEKVVVGGQHKLKDGDIIVDASESASQPVAVALPKQTTTDSVAHASIAPFLSINNSDAPYIRWILPILMLSLASIFLIIVAHFNHIKLAMVMLAVLCYTFVAETKVKKISIQ